MRLVRSEKVSCDRNGSDLYGHIIAICDIEQLDITREMFVQGLVIAYGRYSTKIRQ